MYFLRPSQRLMTRMVPFFLVLALLVAAIPAATAELPADYAIPNGWFFSQTGGGQGQGYAVRDTGVDSGGKPIRFWTEFQQLGGLATLGYPIGQPYAGADGFTYQPFQRGILQWRPELGRAVLSNSFETLSNDGRDNWLSEAKGVPKPISDDGSAGDFAKAVSTRMGWLTDEAIKSKYLANPNPQLISGWNRDRSIELYGLPMSRPEKNGPFISQRFQRITFQLWVESVAGMPPKGSVVGVLGGELMKETGLVPAAATQALGPGGTPQGQPTPPVAQATPSPAPAPASTYSWRVDSVQGLPNCGVTYIRAFTRDANGNGVNGMTLKSWNDWGNEYTDGSRNHNGQDGYWDRIVGPGIRAGKWYVALLDGSGRQASETVTINFTASCDTSGGNVQEAEIVFKEGTAPQAAPPPAVATPTPAPAPSSSYPWRVAGIQGFPNCGTTYIRAFTRDANGNGVNGMTLKSWNDYGNEYVAGTQNAHGTDGRWERVIGPGIRPGKWYVALLDGGGVQSSDVATVNFTTSCDSPSGGNVQEAEVVFQPR